MPTAADCGCDGAGNVTLFVKSMSRKRVEGEEDDDCIHGEISLMKP